MRETSIISSLYTEKMSRLQQTGNPGGAQQAIWVEEMELELQERVGANRMQSKMQDKTVAQRENSGEQLWVPFRIQLSAYQ